MKIKNGVKARLFLMSIGVVAGVTIFLAATQDSSPEAVAYMQKVNVLHFASK